MLSARFLAFNIKKYRKAKGLTQSALARTLFVSPQAVSKWESGLSAPDIENLCKISNVLQVSTDALLEQTSQNNMKGAE